MIMKGVASRQLMAIDVSGGFTNYGISRVKDWKPSSIYFQNGADTRLKELHVAASPKSQHRETRNPYHKSEDPELLPLLCAEAEFNFYMPTFDRLKHPRYPLPTGRHPEGI